MKRLMNVDADTGIVQTAIDDGDGGLIIETSQDITPIIEQNKALYAQTDERARWGEWTRIGSIPMAVIQDLNKKGILRGFHVVDQKKFKAWLNDSENRFFRTRPGRI
jgi:hypothetical protein